MNKKTNFNRRTFLSVGTTSMIGGSLLLSRAAPLVASPKEDALLNTKGFYANPASQKLMSMLDLKVPIIQAPAGGVVTPDLVSAVSNAGGLGGIPLSWADENQAQKIISKVKEKTSKNFFVNFVLNFEPKSLAAAIEAGVPAVQFSWGMPNDAQLNLIRKNKVILGIQVTSRESADEAIRLGADYLVCQGTEAGGHVQATKDLATALQEALAVAGHTPVVVSGGISTGRQIRHYLELGAAGVVMGSRFVASKESGAHQLYKDALVESSAEDTVFTSCMNKGWENATHRILRNSTFKEWEKHGCSVVGKRPGENDKIAGYGATHSSDFNIERYSINSPGKSIHGDIEALANYAGTGISEINEILTVKDIITRLWSEAVS